MPDGQGRRKEFVGVVVSDKMDKTVVVAVERLKRHRLYHKAIRLTKKYKAHDERNEARSGDIVRIVETRPLSKEKRWRVAEIIQRAALAREEREVVKALEPESLGTGTTEPSRGPREA